MKRLIIVVLLFASIVVRAQTPYLNTPYSRENLTTIKEQLAGMLDTSYKFQEINHAPDRPHSHIYFKKQDGEKLTVTINKMDVTNGSPIIDNVVVTAPFNDAFRVYERLFKTEINQELLLKRGYAAPITYTDNGQHIAIAFVKNSSDSKYWDLWIRKV